MKLINADKLTADYIVASTTTNTQCYRYISKEQVENAPTVDAIPIEWIVKWAWAFMDKNSEGYKMAMELLHDWEKENGQETTN